MDYWPEAKKLNLFPLNLSVIIISKLFFSQMCKRLVFVLWISRKKAIWPIS